MEDKTIIFGNRCLWGGNWNPGPMVRWPLFCDAAFHVPIAGSRGGGGSWYRSQQNQRENGKSFSSSEAESDSGKNFIWRHVDTADLVAKASGHNQEGVLLLV
jgi:hypothetical protein